ncbi:hypothetical protein CR513_25178, partial [Mucuna pruriens]
MEMLNLVAKLKSLKLELDEDLIVHLVLISLPAYLEGQINKKIKNIKGVAERSSQGKKSKKNKEFTYFFYKKSRHMKKQYHKYAAWHVKKGQFLALVCFEVNLTFVSTNTWWVDSGTTTHIIVTMQDEILEPLDLSNFKVCVECIKGKWTNIRKLVAEKVKDVLELIHTDVCSYFLITS